MQIRYIGHASIAVGLAGKRVLCDPWWNGPAYTGQWWHYPTPEIDPAEAASAEFVYISHGHEDHLHGPTLNEISRDAVVLIPLFRDTGMRDFVRSFGFRKVIEIGHAERKSLAPGLHATIYLNKEDSVLVLEGEGRTIVNANDALHASSRHVIDHLCSQIRGRHRSIDVLLLGYGGASWFPNCMRITDAQGYDAMGREHVFAENFAYVARRLEPRMTLPFAASFVLLEDGLRWINEAKFRTASPCLELGRQGAQTIRTHYLMPGDRVLDDQIVTTGGPRPSLERANAEIDQLFAAPIAELRTRHATDETRLRPILECLRTNVRSRAPRILRADQRLQCRIDLRDVPEVSLYLDCTRQGATLERCDRLRLAPMVLTTRLAVLEALALQEYGFESISIGYGAMLQVRRRDLALRVPLLAVLGRKPLPPTARRRLRAWLRSPRRSFAVWRRDLHWRRLSLQIRRGQVQRVNDIYSVDPANWSPLREDPVQHVSARARS